VKSPGLALLALVLAGGAVQPALGHVTGVTYAEIAIEERDVRIVLRVPARGLAEHMHPHPGGPASTDEVIRTLGGQITGLLGDVVHVLSGDRRCPANRRAIARDPDPDRVRVHLGFDCDGPVGDVGIHVYVFNEFGPEHSVLARISRAGRTREFVFGPAHTDFRSDREGASAIARLATFLILGVEHIFTGYDHILFIVGLLVIWRGTVNILKVVTAFTLAHSITLILATFSVVNLPSRLVESVIALSIAYVGIENIFVKNIERRWRLAFLFGLVHGFGFASVLAEMGLPSEGLVLSLLSFNVGVEVGQLAIVLVLYPLVYYANQRAYGNLLVKGSSLAIALMGVFWFVQRIV
jgi:hydrogenase/urease accessory protein HupE